MARTRTPPAGNTRLPPTSRCTMYRARLRHSSSKRPMLRKLALYSSVMCDIESPRAFGLLDAHVGDGTSHRERRDGAIVVQPPAALGGGGHGDEGANLETALTPVPIGPLVRV